MQNKTWIKKKKLTESVRRMKNYQWNSVFYQFRKAKLINVNVKQNEVLKFKLILPDNLGEKE